MPHSILRVSMDEENRLATLTFAAWADAFSPEEMDRIEAYGDRLTADRATLLGVPEGQQTKNFDDMRITRTAWIAPGPETRWIYDRMQGVVARRSGTVAHTAQAVAAGESFFPV